MPAKWTVTDEANLVADRAVIRKMRAMGEEPSAWLLAEYNELTERRKQAKPRRRKGDGGVYQRADGLWCVSLELPKGPDKKRRRKTICRSDRAKVIEELAKAKAELESSAAKEAADLEARREALRAERVGGWRGSSRRV